MITALGRKSRGVGPSQVLVVARNAVKNRGKIGAISAFLRAKVGR
jgi:hypothetical protein